MKKLFLSLIFSAICFHGLNAAVFLCVNSDPLFPEPCERIDRVRIDGVWQEANCENVEVPDGWIIDCCC